jgi:polyferredoxin
MGIRTVRRITQGFFLLLFIWFCAVSNLGEQWWQLRGWPINWLLQLDPLVGLGTLLTTRTIYSGLIWGLATVALTIILGRFFCGWLCPFGCIHQMVGVLGKRRQRVRDKLELNQYRRLQSFKYWVLVFLLSAAAGDLLGFVFYMPVQQAMFFWVLVIFGLIFVAVMAQQRQGVQPRRAVITALTIVVLWAILCRFSDSRMLLPVTLQTGLLDPIPLLYRSINLVILPPLDSAGLHLNPIERIYDGAWIIGGVFMTAVLLNLFIPRFYCRFICPLGALFGVLNRFAIWRIRKKEMDTCKNCHLCEQNCEGACQPSTQIRVSECVLCLNCMDNCPHGLMGYGTKPSETGEVLSLDLSRRRFNVALIAGLAALPMVRLSGQMGSNWNPALIRPPGALREEEFIARCIKCGQCMRVCPTNVIQAAGLSGGIEGIWTPELNFRVGTSGCQFNCIACGNVCPTAAIRPLSLDERMGKNDFAEDGPIRIGTAFVDRGRCLPWAMDRPCIVCQENCPVSPKAIITQVNFRAVHKDSVSMVKGSDLIKLKLLRGGMIPERYATGDYYIRTGRQKDGQALRPIVANTEDTAIISGSEVGAALPSKGTAIEIMIRLQQPVVDPERCIGCGVCQHECPVKGKRAIRVSAENETRNPQHRLLV